MAVNDIVAARIAQSSPSSFQGAPSFGHVAAEAGGPPLTKTIVWADSALVSTPEADSEADFNLDVIEDASQQTVDRLLGKVVLPIAVVGATSTDPAGGTSREYAGLVVAVYSRRPSDAQPGSGEEHALILAEAGEPTEYFEDLATRFVVLAVR